MRISERPEAPASAGRLSLILPLNRGRALREQVVAEYRRILEQKAAGESIEVITVGACDEDPGDPGPDGHRPGGPTWAGATHVETDGGDWSASARAGLATATGDHLIVLDVERHYAPESLLQVMGPIRTGISDLAVAVPTPNRSDVSSWWPPRFGFGWFSRLVLGSSDVFSGLFAVRRSFWERGGRTLSASGSSLVLELLLRRPARAVDVPVPVNPQFRSQRLGLKDLRPLKHVLDGRYGNFSRLIQFCAVGASGMVVDLSLYALFQWLLSWTPLVSQTSKLFGFSWHLAVSGALSIAMALLWNFSLNRRLTFNDALRGSWFRQYLTYALSNAPAIALNFMLRVYLPTRAGFFARHKLAAAAVGIIMATGISFSMSRWIVFGRRGDHKPSAHRPAQPPIGQASTVV
jgi:dolichol-phosphate mannosyltransferase